MRTRARTALCILLLGLAAPSHAQSPGADLAEPELASRARSLIGAMDEFARPMFSNLPLPANFTADDGRTMALLDQAPPDLAWQRHWLRGHALANDITGTGDPAAAIAAFEAAVAAANGPDDARQALAARIAIANLLWPSDPATATARLNAITTSLPEAQAAIAQLRGRIALSAGDHAGALAAFAAAMAAAARAADSGMPALLRELTADVALAHGMAGRADLATAHVGALEGGRRGGDVPRRGRPVCLPALGLGPQTQVVFSVRTMPNGAPLQVAPVWSAGPITPRALAQLRAAISFWRWEADDAAMQAGSRVSLGCAADGDAMAILNSRIHDIDSHAIIDDFLAARGVPAAERLPPIPPDFKLGDAMAANIGQIEAGGDRESIRLLLPYLVLAASMPDEADAAMQRALAIAARHGAPEPLIALLNIVRWARPGDAAHLASAAIALEATLARLEPAQHGTPIWLGVLGRLLGVADWRVQALPPDSPDLAGARTALAAAARRVLALPPTILPADDDLRRAAGLALARLLAQDGSKSAAIAQRRSAGLIDTLCELADAPRNLTGVMLYDTDFPLAARKADIAGIIYMERATAADGSTASTRMVVARPPLIFDAPSIAAGQRGRQAPPRLGGKASACINPLQPVRWRLTE